MSARGILVLVAAATAWLAGCETDAGSSDGFGGFWAEFAGAVSRDSEPDVRALTRLPFLFEGEPHDGAAFPAVYAGLFDADIRGCIAEARPVAEEDGYQVQCGPIILVFGRESGRWLFTEFTADPEAVEGTGDQEGSVGAAGIWRITSGAAAPWSVGSAAARREALRGETVEFVTDRVIGPPPLGCGDARYTFVVTPAEGLFQGNLPAPAEAAARAAGVPSFPVMTLRVSCDTGSFDYHLASPDVMFTALDGVVWRLEGAPGHGPRDVVLALLREHMTGDMGFTPATMERKRRLFAPELDALVGAYFERPLPVDEPPPINGDPITDSQEYPEGFRFGELSAEGDNARVEVIFFDRTRTRRVVVLLSYHRDAWLIDDLAYERGETLREALRSSY